MAYQELRQHLRIRTQGKAIVQLADGSRVRCEVNDMSLGGAYLLRSTEFGPPADLVAGESVTVTMFDTHHGNSYELFATVVRVEPNGGPGLALKWDLDDKSVQKFADHIAHEAIKQQVAPEALGVPALSSRRSKLSSVHRISKVVLPTVVFFVVFGAVTLGWTWIKTIMSSG